MDIRLERMTEKNIDTYIALEKRVESRTYAAVKDHQEALEEMAQGPVYFIKRGDDVVGVISYSTKEDGSVFLNGLAIQPEFQGKGIGRAAVELILEEVKDAKKVVLVTHPENERAIALYQSLGFTITDRIENYHGDGEPRIVLTCEQ